MFQFIESIRVENQKPFLVDLHQNRVNDTFRHFQKDNRIDLQNIISTLQIDENGLFKLRIVYDLHSNYRTQLVPYAFSNLTDFELIENNEIDYSFKYEDRSVFTKMKQKAEGEEIIIVKNNCITDTSYSNLLFLKDKTWFTPTTYLLNGVQRQFLLKKKLIKETEITFNNIKTFTHFQMINAMNTMDNDFVYPIEKIINLPKQDTDYMEIL